MYKTLSYSIVGGSSKAPNTNLADVYMVIEDWMPIGLHLKYRDTAVVKDWRQTLLPK